MKYVQIHELVSYPASNLNRDDLGRPKSVKIGESTRLRISSQSLKRAWRVSDIMDSAFPELGIRTNKLPEAIKNALINGRSLQDEIRGVEASSRDTVDAEIAEDYAKRIIACLKKGVSEKDSAGKKGEEKKEEDKNKEDEKKKKEGSNKELFHYSPSEIKQIDEVMEKVAKGESPSIPNMIVTTGLPADIAMFGRMVAGAPKFNCEASVQVAHAFTVHKAVIEDDFFTSVDDLSTDEEGGAGHLGEIGFGAGLFYIYICVDMELLAKNIGSESDAKKALETLIDVAIKVSPTGKQSTFASRAYASYVLVEKGDEQPRSLASSFLKPIRGDDMLVNAIDALRENKKKMDDAFGPCSDECREINIPEGKGSLKELHAFLG